MAYPAKTWAKVKADYETGNFSVADLWKKYGIAEITIEKRIGNEKWKKGKLKKKIEEKIEESTLEMFARLGMPKEKFLQVIIDGLNADRTYIKKDGSGEGFIEVEPDHAARSRYVTEVNKMTGGYVPEKKEISGDPENPLIHQIERIIVKHSD